MVRAESEPGGDGASARLTITQERLAAGKSGMPKLSRQRGAVSIRACVRARARGVAWEVVPDHMLVRAGPSGSSPRSTSPPRYDRPASLPVGYAVSARAIAPSMPAFEPSAGKVM